MKKTRLILAILIGYLAVTGIEQLYNIHSDSAIFSNSVFAGMIFITFSYFTYAVLQKQSSMRELMIAVAGGGLLSAMTSMGYSLNYTDTIWKNEVAWGTVCLLPFFSICVMRILRFSQMIYIPPEAAEPGKRRYFILWGLLFLSWTPVLLASWPGIFAYDSPMQLNWFMDGTISAHHPILHTYMLGICMRAGQILFQSNQAGAAIYSILQMLLLSAMFAGVCYYLAKKRAPKALQIGSFLFFAFHPVNSLMALCATKDTLFSGVFCLMVIQLIEMLEHTQEFFASWKKQALFCTNLFFLFALRNNGIYAFLLSVPFFILIFRKYWKKMLLLIIICLGLYKGYTGPVYSVLQVEAGDPREMCCVLMQSAARAYNLVNLDLTEEEKEGFYTVIPEEGLRSYLSHFADPVKYYFDGEAFVQNPKPFLKAWASVGRRHTKIYVDAFLANTFGYWYPGAYMMDSTGQRYLPYTCIVLREDTKVVMDPKLPHLAQFYDRLGNQAIYQDYPVLAMLFQIGGYIWMLLIATFILIFQKRYRSLMAYIPLWMYFFTTLLGPVATLRYAYPVIACAPLILYITLKREE